MDFDTLFFYATPGGMLVGLGAILLFLSLGKIAGISGIFFGMFRRPLETWRPVFLLGAILGSALVIHWLPALAQITRPAPSSVWLVLSGFIVGLGTRMANGCTSGHGVCGLGRLSIRSLVAVISFMVSGIVAATFLRHLLGVV